MGKNPLDAVGISSKVAERLSGADFDGDTVMVIPTGKNVKTASKPPLRGLEGFDSKSHQYDEKSVDANGNEHYYRNGREFKVMRNTQTEMGKVSNLITDMTLRGATEEELARAVRHSMVVIDAEKHKLDYKQSETENGIASLKKKYQGTYDEDGRYHEGAATLLSRAKSEVQVLKRKGSPRVNEKGKPWYDPTKPEGVKVYKEVEETYVDSKGKTQVRTQKSTRMAETSDAYSLVSDANTPQERAYADYANTMKSMAREARLISAHTGKIEYSAEAKAVYREEVSSLNAKLNVALKNAPRERQAQLMAAAEVKAKKEANPDLTNKEKKKLAQQALARARTQVGASRKPVEITDREWEAIQAGAISENKLMQILNHTDGDKIKERATPRTSKELSQAKANRISALKANGYTNAEIAKALGVSTSTVSKYLK
jgi:DNA-binding NarL/FixJ family response regulator